MNPLPVLLVVVAHPDDETFGCGTTIAWASASGYEVVVCCATRGEAGEHVDGRSYDPETLGRLREAELLEAAEVLGVDEVHLLGFADSGWDGDPPPGALVNGGESVIEAIGELMVKFRPAVVVTMDPTGSDGHRDHAAIGVAATEAFRRFAEPDSRLYRWCLPRSLMERWVNEEARRNGLSVYLEVELGRPDADITTVIDGTGVSGPRRAALEAHRSQQSPYAGVDAELVTAFLDADHLVRVVPEWSGGPLENDLGPWPQAVVSDRVGADRPIPMSRP